MGFHKFIIFDIFLLEQRTKVLSIDVGSNPHCLFLTLNKSVYRAARTLLSKQAGVQCGSPRRVLRGGKWGPPASWAEVPGGLKPLNSHAHAHTPHTHTSHTHTHTPHTHTHTHTHRSQTQATKAQAPTITSKGDRPILPAPTVGTLLNPWLALTYHLPQGSGSSPVFLCRPHHL
jgi:hypothetical protein